MRKRDRHQQILEIVRGHRVTSQEALRELLHERGTEVTQATLSRDMRELRLVKVPGTSCSSDRASGFRRYRALHMLGSRASTVSGKSMHIR